MANYADNGVSREVLNELKMTIEKRKIVTTKILIHFKLVRCFVIFETDISFKEINSHDYLNY